MQSTIYTGSEDTMRKISERGYIAALNPNTMRYQKLHGKMEAVKDETMELSWKVICDIDLRAIAKERGYIL